VAHVRTIAQSVRDLTGGLDRFEVDATSVRALLAVLGARYPGLEQHLRESMVVAVDGEMHPGAWDQPLAPDAEVVFIPMIPGG
jgi:molybdopterin converting factor small subunit